MLPLDAGEAAHLSGATDDGKILLGIRPEHIRIAAPDDPRDGLLMRVDVVEPIGPRTIVHTTAGAEIVKVVAEKRFRVAADSTVKLIVDRAARSYFDAATGTALGHGGGDGAA